MSDGQHALEKFLRDAAAGASSSVSVEVRPDFDYLNLRGDPGNANFLSAAAKVLRVELPLAPNTFAAEMSTVFWLGPDEWLIVSPGGQRPTLPTLLDDALSGMHATLNEISGAQIVLRVTGKNAAAMLAKGCTLDLHPKVFLTGQCAQTGLAKTGILLAKVTDSVFDVYVRRSFAEYLALWLQRAGAEYGIRFE